MSMRRLCVVLLALLAAGLAIPATAERNGTPTVVPAATPATRLDEATRQRLTILAFPPAATPTTVMVGSLGASIGLQPGQETLLALGIFDFEVCGIGNRCFIPLPVSAAWSVAPAKGARIGRDSGILTIDPATASGTVFTVSATLHGDQHVVTTEIAIYTPEARPLVGTWQEFAQHSCRTGEEVAPELAIEELVFSADGKFTVTWTPFESYVDYWGTYTVDPIRGTIDLHITGGNAIPPDVDGRGGIAGDGQHNLILTDLWLGSSSQGQGAIRCGHHFVR